MEKVSSGSSDGSHLGYGGHGGEDRGVGSYVSGNRVNCVGGSSCHGNGRICEDGNNLIGSCGGSTL